MKKVLFIVGVVIIFTASSCKKTCTCVTTQDGVEIQKVEMETKGKCDELNVTQTSGGMTIKTTCN